MILHWEHLEMVKWCKKLLSMAPKHLGHLHTVLIQKMQQKHIFKNAHASCPLRFFNMNLLNILLENNMILVIIKYHLGNFRVLKTNMLVYGLFLPQFSTMNTLLHLQQYKGINRTPSACVCLLCLSLSRSLFFSKWLEFLVEASFSPLTFSFKIFSVPGI